ncbi:MAG: 30S ribosomal protein S9 [Candidatus Magasanikbacteria bacterium]|nr:30S ribosomal protein S9 [Candidatus Magasanikbacteria bacterium]
MPKVEKKVGRDGKYIYAVGRRKSAKAQVKLMETGKGVITVNGKPLKDFFTYFILQAKVVSPLKAVQEEETHDVVAMVKGGGPIGQAEAIRLGIARALIKWNEAFKPALKKMGFMTRDPRVKERKKFGLKKARRAPQWSKR